MPKSADEKRPTIMVGTRRCIICGEAGEVEMPVVAYKKWHEGALIQDAWPEGTVDEREQLINGLHAVCSDELFAGFGEDEDY